MAPLRKTWNKRETARTYPLEELKGYAKKGVAELANTLVEIAQSHDENKRAEIVLPSRGAVSPTIHAILTLLAGASSSKTKHRDRLESVLSKIYVPPFLVGILEMILDKGNKDLLKKITDENAPVRFVILPFTADVNIETLKQHMEKHGKDAYERYLGIRENIVPNNDKIKIEIRKGGVRILKEMMKPPEERLPLYTAFTNLIEAEGRGDVASRYRKYYIDPKSDLYIVDTVISGTAATHIKRAFDEEKLHVKPLLLVDRNGTKLHPEKEKILKIWSIKEGGRIILTPRLPAEDRGVGLLGVAALVYPQIGMYLRKMGEKYYPNLFGTWVPVHQVNRIFQDAFKRYTRVVLLSLTNDKDKQLKAYENFLNALNRNKHILLRHGMTTPDDLRYQLGSLAKKNTILHHKDIDEVYETNARVAHIYYHPQRAKKYIERIIS